MQAFELFRNNFAIKIRIDTMMKGISDITDIIIKMHYDKKVTEQEDSLSAVEKMKTN